MLSLPDFDWNEAEQERNRLLAKVKPDLDVADFVVLRNTMDKIIESAKVREREFTQALVNSADPFVNDISNSDPLAFIVRGTLQIENQIVKGLQVFGLSAKSDTLHDRINALSTSPYFTASDLVMLHEIRKLRNGVAHELDAGRAVSPVVASAAYGNLEQSTKAYLRAIVDQDPASLAPEILIKLLLSHGYQTVDGAIWHHEMQQQLRRALRVP